MDDIEKIRNSQRLFTLPLTFEETQTYTQFKFTPSSLDFGEALEFLFFLRFFRFLIEFF